MTLDQFALDKMKDQLALDKMTLDQFALDKMTLEYSSEKLLWNRCGTTIL